MSRSCSLEPTVLWDNSQLPLAPRGGECVSGLGHWVGVEAGLLAQRTLQEQAGLGGGETGGARLLKAEEGLQLIREEGAGLVSMKRRGQGFCHRS